MTNENPFNAGRLGLYPLISDLEKSNALVTG